jgi:hypothetical protein
VDSDDFAKWSRVMSESEVSPRSSGGSPNDARLEQLANRIERYCDNGRPNDGDALRREAAYLRTVAAQVSALRQEAAALTARLAASQQNSAKLGERYDFWFGIAKGAAEELGLPFDGHATELRPAIAAARQEAETLTRQRDAAIREISVIAREAETLRGQLEAEEARLDFLSSWTRGDSGICPPGNHGGESGTWLFFRQDDAKGDSYGLWNDVETEGLTLREAIDAARVAAPREPK